MTLVNAETGEIVGRGSHGNVDINHVKIEGRHRVDLGDIDALAESIRNVGLLHPLVVDGELRLIAGQRRLEACRSLGWPNVPVRVVRQIKDAEKALEAERDENTCRKQMTPSELKSLTDNLLEIERPKAAERRAEAGSSNLPGASPAPRGTTSGNGASTAIAAKAAGWSRTSYQRATKLHKAADDESLPEDVRIRALELIEQVDKAALTLNAAERELSEALAGVSAPPRHDRSRAGVAERVAKAKQMAAEGCTSRQIAEALGISVDNMGEFRQRHGIEVPADAVVGRTKRIDSNRVVTETVHGLDGFAMGVELVAFDTLDAQQIEGWVTSLSNSLRSLNRFLKQLKEMTHE